MHNTDTRNQDLLGAQERPDSMRERNLRIAKRNDIMLFALAMFMFFDFMAVFILPFFLR